MIHTENELSVGRLQVYVFQALIHTWYDLLGVLTKPDRSPEAAQEKWVRYIDGEIEPLHHGWFCVKQYDTQSGYPQPTLAEARDQEVHWFGKTSVWRDLPRPARSRLGTKKLVQYLEEILSDLIQNRYAIIASPQCFMANNLFVGFRLLASRSRG
jgi:hypothetical protein